MIDARHTCHARAREVCLYNSLSIPGETIPAIPDTPFYVGIGTEVEGCSTAVTPPSKRYGGAYQAWQGGLLLSGDLLEEAGQVGERGGSEGWSSLSFVALLSLGDVAGRHEVVGAAAIATANPGKKAAKTDPKNDHFSTSVTHCTRPRVIVPVWDAKGVSNPRHLAAFVPDSRSNAAEGTAKARFGTIATTYFDLGLNTPYRRAEASGAVRREALRAHVLTRATHGLATSALYLATRHAEPSRGPLYVT